MIEICERNKCLSDYKLQQAKYDIRHISITAINNLYEIKIVLNYLNNPQNLIDKETKKRQLSTNRAQSVYKYLVFRRIPKSRMTFKGYGNTVPLGKGAEYDRRVELVITKIN